MENKVKIELNEAQKNALLQTEGAVLVTAGAGSGKTRLLTQRIYHLITEKNVPQENILAITFTNKASLEMKERVKTMLNGECRVWISTIHSMCATILRSNIQRLHITGINNHFTIFGSDDSAKIIKDVIKDIQTQSDEDEGITKQISYHLSNMKNKDIDLVKYREDLEQFSSGKVIAKVIEEYQNRLASNNALDFDDLLVYTRRLLSIDDGVRAFYQDKFKYILVDEFQDTNIVQYNIIKLLAGRYKNIFVVGDEDQCIYGWRGANIANIKNFIKDYEDCKVFKLEQNYRCTKNILKLANNLIKNNKERIEKTLYTENNEGNPACFRTFNKDKDEAEFVARTIYTLHNEKGVDYNDIAVLMRLNALSRNFEDKFMNYNIPYVIYGGFKFFDRLEVKTMLSYLRFVYNPSDSLSMEKIINYPKRGIGDVTVEKLIAIQKETKQSLMQILANINIYLEFNTGTKFKLLEFYQIIKNIQDNVNTLSISELLNFIYRESRLRSLYFEEKTEENQNRDMNVNNLIEMAEEFEKNTQDATIEKFLESVALVSDVDTTNDSSSIVKIATVHAVKGLEFKYVFIVGLEQKVFPIIREDTVEEEERRLLYVAITRAKEMLYLTNCSRRWMYNRDEDMTPSIFLKELGFVTASAFDARNNRIKIKTYGMSSYCEDYDQLNENNDSITYNSFKSKRPLSELNGSKVTFKGDNVVENKKQTKQGFTVGKRVNHSHYGEGVIVDVKGSGNSTMVDVAFSVGVKSLLLEFAPLNLID